jgi:hypothetical protein
MLLVELEDFPTLSDPLIEHDHLTPTDSSAYIAQPIVVSNVSMLVMGCRIPGLRGKEPCFFDPFLSLRHKGATT